MILLETLLSRSKDIVLIFAAAVTQANLVHASLSYPRRKLALPNVFHTCSLRLHFVVVDCNRDMVSCTAQTV